MLPNQPKIINKKALLCSRAFLLKSDHSDRRDPAHLSQVNLLKFFPKYIHKLVIDTKTGPTISKVKRVKILHVFQENQSQNQSPNLRRSLLYNKEKHIQSFYDEDKLDSRTFVREILTFKGLRSLKILSESQSPLALRKICQYVKYFYKLEHIELEIDSKSTMSTISMIDSYERLLKSLISLKIDCAWKKYKSHEDNINLFRDLLKNKNMLKSTTSLKLGALNDQAFYELFEQTLANCPTLGSLQFATDDLRPDDDSWENPELKAEDYKPIDYQYLQALGGLNHLHTVNITCKNMSTFVRDFTLPPSIQNVKLSLPSFSPSFMFLREGSKAYKIFLNFCKKWSQLANIKTLNIAFNQLSDYGGSSMRFLQPWLKHIHNLQNLKLELSSESSTPYHWRLSANQGSLDISGILESIQHLKNTLKTLALSDNGLIYSLKNFPKEPFGFNYLDKFSLQGFLVPKEFDLSQLFQVNLKGLLIKNERQVPFELILEGYYFDSVDSFAKFMKSFDHDESEERRFVRTKMTVYVRIKDSHTSHSDIRSRYFTIESKSLCIQMQVVGNAKFSDLSNNPKILLRNNLKSFRVQEEIGNDVSS